MIVTIRIDTYQARQALVMTSGSLEQADHYVHCDEQEIIEKTIQHMRGWGITLDRGNTDAD